MNIKIGAVSSIVNLLAVLGFATSVLLHFNFGSYFCSMFIAFSFLTMMCCFLHFTVPERKAAGYATVAFASAYVAIILLVYFTQLTTVRFGGLTEQAQELLDFQQMNLFFNFDLLGYALMALATFFCRLNNLPEKESRQMAAGIVTDSRCLFHKLSAVADTGYLSSGQSSVEWRSGVGVLVCLFLPGDNSIVSVLSKQGGTCK